MKRPTTSRAFYLLDNLADLSGGDVHSGTMTRRSATIFVILAFVAGILIGLLFGHFQWNKGSDQPAWKSFPLNTQ